MPGQSPGWSHDPGGNIGAREMVIERQLAVVYRTRLIGLLTPHAPFQSCTVCQMAHGKIQGVDVFNNYLAELNRRDIYAATQDY